MEGDIFHMCSRNPNKLSETTWIEIALLELGTHRDASTLTVMAAQTRNMMSYDDPIPYLKFVHSISYLDYLPRYLVS